MNFKQNLNSFLYISYNAQGSFTRSVGLLEKPVWTVGRNFCEIENLERVHDVAGAGVGAGGGGRAGADRGNEQLR